MKFIRYILSHGILILFLIGSVFVYLNRESFFPDLFPGEKTSSIPATQEATPEAASARSTTVLENSTENPDLPPLHVDTASTADYPLADTEDAPTDNRPQTSDAPESSSLDAPETIKIKLAQARESYWNHDIRSAEQQYREAGKLFPDDPQPWGELGNLLFTEKRLPEAAQAYYESAIRFRRSGNQQQALNLLSTIRNMNPTLAGKLEQQLDLQSNPTDP